MTQTSLTRRPLQLRDQEACVILDSTAGKDFVSPNLGFCRDMTCNTDGVRELHTCARASAKARTQAVRMGISKSG